MGKILLLGGTGAMGVYLAPELVSDGHEVHVTTRLNIPNASSLLQYISGNARDESFVERITREQSYDAIVDFMIYSTDEFKHRRDHLLCSTEHYLFLSSYRVFADTGKKPITERSPRLIDVCKDSKYLATDEYALAKARQEDILRDSSMQNWTILRPCITYSKNRFQFGTLEANTLCYRAIQGVPVIMAREILSKTTTMTWAGDAAKLIARLILKEHALKDDFNVATSEHHTWNEVADVYRDAIGLQIVESDLDTYEKVVGGKYQIRYDRLLHRRLDNQKILQSTGLAQSEFMSLSDGLKIELNNYRLAPNFTHLDLGLHARMDVATYSNIGMNTLSSQQIIEYKEHRKKGRNRLNISKRILGFIYRFFKSRE
jgi:nucleoside-diphosphate-sugar epimerase